MKIFSLRISYFYAFCAALLLVVLSFFFEFWMKLEPCPLCIMQRVTMMLLCLCYFIVVIFPPKKTYSKRIFSSIALLIALLGASVAGRQVWLQHLPESQVPACGPGLNFMVKNFPLSETVQMVFQGSGECAQVQWTFLHLSMPEWTLICFVLFAVLALYNIYRSKKE